MSHLPFQLGSTFCNISQTVEQSLGVIGAPVDCATSFRSGARMAPLAIRQASLMLTDGEHELYPHDLKQWVQDLGNIDLPTGNTIEMLTRLEQTFDALHHMHIATIGGDHSITLGILRSLAKKHGPMALVHFDAHCDTWTDHFGQPYGHGTWLYNAINENLIDPSHAISIGIRSPADKVSRSFLSNQGGRTISAREAMKCSPDLMISAIRAKIQDKPCYLSLDIDCLDPTYAPGTGTPEIGGLSSIWLQEVIDEMYWVNWVGMDCVEVCPPYDHGEITSLAASTFVWQYLSMNIDRKFIKKSTSKRK